MNNKKIFLYIENAVIIFFLVMLCFGIIGKLADIEVLSFISFLAAFDFPLFLSFLVPAALSAIIYFVLFLSVPVIGFIKFRDHNLRHIIYTGVILVMIGLYVYFWYSLFWLG